MDKKTKQSKKIYTLKDAGGDLSKTWYIETYRSGFREKFRTGINVHQTIEGRKKAADDLIKHLQKSFTPPACNISQVIRLEEAFKQWSTTVRSSSMQSYRSKLRSLTSWLNGREINKELLKSFFSDYALNHEQSTTYDCYVMLKMIFEQAGISELFEGIKVKNGENKPLKYFQQHQQKQLYEYLNTNNHELWLYCMFIYYCFLRPRAELRFLKVGDIYFDEKKIRIPGEHSKNKKTQFVKIPNVFYPHLEFLKNSNPNEYIFPGRKNSDIPIGRNTMGRKFRKILDSFGYNQDFQLYSWKHTGVINCANAGVPIVKLMKQLRHHSLDQTYQYMRQLGIEDMNDLAELFPMVGIKKMKTGKENYFCMTNDGLVIKLSSFNEAKRYINEKSINVFKTIIKNGDIDAVSLRPK